MGNDTSLIQPVAAPEVSRTGRALALLGDHWTLLILNRVFSGEHKYHELREALGASDSVLSSRLATLSAGGILTKEPYRNGRIRYEYRLSEAGKATWKIYVAAWAWERQWLPLRPGRNSALFHKVCGEYALPALICGKCGLEVDTRETTIVKVASNLAYIGSAPRRHRQRRHYENEYEFGFGPETMELLGDRWNLALLSAAVIGIRRFTDFEKFLGIPPTVLSSRLARFVEFGVLENQELVASGRTVYRFTDKGRGLTSVLMQFVEWADENVHDGHTSSIEIQHDPCGSKLRTEFSCGSCKAILRRREVRFDFLDS